MHFPIFSTRRSGVELSTLSTTPKLTSLPEDLEPRQKSVTDVGLDYAAGTKPVFGSGDRPRGPPAITGPSENPMPKMGYFSGSITDVLSVYTEVNCDNHCCTDGSTAVSPAVPGTQRGEGESAVRLSAPHFRCVLQPEPGEGGTAECCSRASPCPPWTAAPMQSWSPRPTQGNVHWKDNSCSEKISSFCLAAALLFSTLRRLLSILLLRHLESFLFAGIDVAFPDA